MRTYGTLLAVAVVGLAMGCGGGSGGSTSSGRTGSNGGQCPASSSGQTCTGEEAYQTCSMSACEIPYKTCFGANYAKGDFTGGSCADFMACQLKCPCGTAEAKTCEAACAMQLMQTTPGQTCMTCLTALATCVTGAACAEPVCTTPGGGLDAGVTTGGNCAAAQACCTTLAALSPAAAQSCTTAVSSANGQDAACASILDGLKSGGLCQ